MPTYIGICNNKGSAGKTPTTYYLGLHFARMGKVVTFIDLDGQANLTDMLHPGMLYQPTIADVLNQDCYIDEAVTHVDLSTGEHVRLIASSGDLYDTEARLSTGMGVMRIYSALAEAQEDTLGDIVLMDTPPNLGPMTDGMIVAVGMFRGYILIPTRPDRHSVAGIRNIQSHIAEARHIPGCDPYLLGTIATQVRETNTHKTWLESLATTAYPTLLGSTPLRGGDTADYELRNAYAPIADQILKMIGGRSE